MLILLILHVSDFQIFYGKNERVLVPYSDLDWEIDFSVFFQIDPDGRWMNNLVERIGLAEIFVLTTAPTYQVVLDILALIGVDLDGQAVVNSSSYPGEEQICGKFIRQSWLINHNNEMRLDLNGKFARIGCF